MSIDIEQYSESESMNYSRDVLRLVKQHSLLAPDEEEFLKNSFYNL